MEASAYEQYVDLMQFYEVYCSKTDSVISGDASKVLLIFGTLLAGYLVCWLG